MTAEKQNISERKASLGENLMMWLIPLALTLIQRLYGLTIRRVDINREPVEKLRREGKPWIYGFWHTNVLFTPYLMRKDGFIPLVSSSKDGEMITRVVRLFGNQAIRGSSSKGGMKALRQVIAALKNGNHVGITPDGPRGPAMEIKDGIINAARNSGAPIIFYYYAATSQWVLEKSWDRHIVPKPFSTLVMSYSPPIDIKELSHGKDDEEVKKELKKLFQETIDRCQQEIEKLKNS